MTVTSGTGKPGEFASFKIRGNTSVNSAGALVIIDGMPGDINTVNPQDIETISVLKDAASAAIYGARAAEGVVLVTTKKGTSVSILLHVCPKAIQDWIMHYYPMSRLPMPDWPFLFLKRQSMPLKIRIRLPSPTVRSGHTLRIWTGLT